MTYAPDTVFAAIARITNAGQDVPLWGFLRGLVRCGGGPCAPLGVLYADALRALLAVERATDGTFRRAPGRVSLEARLASLGSTPEDLAPPLLALCDRDAFDSVAWPRLRGAVPCSDDLLYLYDDGSALDIRPRDRDTLEILSRVLLVLSHVEQRMIVER